jgi:hypothetical protein
VAGFLISMLIPYAAVIGLKHHRHANRNFQTFPDPWLLFGNRLFDSE